MRTPGNATEMNEMGSTAQDLKNLKKNGKGRGSVKNSERLSALFTGGGKGMADWDTVNPAWLHAVVVRMSRIGGAATFGVSRDGGAYMLTLLLDGDRQVLWFNGDADVNAELENACYLIDTLSAP